MQPSTLAYLLSVSAAPFHALSHHLRSSYFRSLTPPSELIGSLFPSFSINCLRCFSTSACFKQLNIRGLSFVFVDSNVTGDLPPPFDALNVHLHYPQLRLIPVRNRNPHMQLLPQPQALCFQPFRFCATTQFRFIFYFCFSDRSHARSYAQSWHHVLVRRCYHELKAGGRSHTSGRQCDHGARMNALAKDSRRKNF